MNLGSELEILIVLPTTAKLFLKSWHNGYLFYCPEKKWLWVLHVYSNLNYNSNSSRGKLLIPCESWELPDSMHFMVSICREAGADAIDMQQQDRNTSTGRQSYRLLALLLKWIQTTLQCPIRRLLLHVLLPTQSFQKATEILLGIKRNLGFDNFLPSWQCSSSYSFTV